MKCVNSLSIKMCNDHPDDPDRRALSLAGLLESCARLFRASLCCDSAHVDDATNACHTVAYTLEHQPSNHENED